MLTKLKNLFDPFHREISRRLASFAMSLPEQSIVLDAGSGEGQYRSMFSHCRLIGIDNAVGDQQWDYSSLDILGDLHHIPLKSESVDAVVCVVTLEHLHSPWIAMEEMGRVTREGGSGFFVFPFMWELHQEPNDYFRFSFHAFERLATAAGFKVVLLEPMGGLFRLLHYRTASVIKHAFRRPLLFLCLIPFLPLMAGYLIASTAVDRVWKLCDHTLGYTSILIKER